MITESTMLADDFSDDVLEILKLLNSYSSWVKSKHQLVDKLHVLLTTKGYIFFHATNANRYRISSVGASYLYDVPLYKQGHLSPFRGQRVRIVCTNSGPNSWRGFMANAVSVSPPDKIIKKLPRRLVPHYSFPDYINDHEVLYKSPRYIVFRINDKLKILSEYAPEGYIDTNGWNAILVDGKAGAPTATLQLRDDGSARGKLIRRGGEAEFDSLREAIDDLAKPYRWYI